MEGSGEHLRSLVAYNQWANDRILDVLEDVGDLEFEKPYGASYGSLRGTLSHILATQFVWEARFRGDRVGLDASFARAELYTAFEASHADLERFAQDLTDEDFSRVLDYLDTRGTPHRRSIGLLVTHVVNHGTYHRGEASLILTTLGRSPGDLDYVYFVPES